MSEIFFHFQITKEYDRVAALFKSYFDSEQWLTSDDIEQDQLKQFSDSVIYDSSNCNIQNGEANIFDQPDKYYELVDFPRRISEEIPDSEFRGTIECNIWFDDSEFEGKNYSYSDYKYQEEFMSYDTDELPDILPATAFQTDLNGIQDADDNESNSNSLQNLSDLDDDELEEYYDYDSLDLDELGDEIVDIHRAEIGDAVEFGLYERTPIIWRVLRRTDDSLLLLSKDIVEVEKYNEIDEDTTWENCSLRKWLNSVFVEKAFSNDEKKLLVESSVTADRNHEYETEAGNDTIDKVFLLSSKEYEEEYFNLYEMMQSRIERRVYLKIARMKEVDLSEFVTKKYGAVEDRWGYHYWLRTTGVHQNYADTATGFGLERYGLSVDMENVGVRPVIQILITN